MGHSIQEILKKINSGLTYRDCLSIGITVLFLLIFFWYIQGEISENRFPVTYTEK